MKNAFSIGSFGFSLNCGAHLDPGEVCDCRETKKTALDATNIQDGGVEQGLTDAVSTSHDTRE